MGQYSPNSVPDWLPPGKQSGVEPGPLWASVGEPDLGCQAFSMVLTFWNQASRGHLWLAVGSSTLSLTWELKAAGSPVLGHPCSPSSAVRPCTGRPGVGAGQLAGLVCRFPTVMRSACLGVTSAGTFAPKAPRGMLAACFDDSRDDASRSPPARSWLLLRLIMVLFLSSLCLPPPVSLCSLPPPP